MPAHGHPKPDRVSLAAGVDPGGTRVRAATATVATVAATAALAWVLRSQLPSAPSLAILYASVFAMFSNIVVREPSPSRRRVTTALMATTALPATVVGSVLSAHHVLVAMVFVAVLMAAVWVRRFGARAEAIGMGAVVPFFSTQFFGSDPSQTPWLVAAAALGIAMAVVVRGWLFADGPDDRALRLARAFRARAYALVLAVDDVLHEAYVDPDGSSASRHTRRVEGALRRLRRARDRLEQTSMDVLNAMPTDAGPAIAGDGTAARVFDVELALGALGIAARRLVRAADDVRRGTPDAATAGSASSLVSAHTGVAHLLGALAVTAGDARVCRETAAARSVVAEVGAVDDVVRDVLAAVHAAANAVERVRPAARRPDPDTPSEDGSATGTAASSPAAAPGPQTGGSRTLLPTTRQALQLGVAAVAAIVTAGLIAPQRWVWAVIAAFVVFNGTQTRGDVLGRGWLRVTGSVGGALLGDLVAAAVGGHHSVSIVLVFVALFLAFYFGPLSAGLLALFVTTALALLYGLLGRFSPDLLALRVEETVIGAAAGVLAAAVVLPRGTRAAVDQALEELLVTMGSVVAAIAEKGSIRGSEDEVVMRTQLAAVRDRARPLSGLHPGTDRYRRLVDGVSLCQHYLLGVARSSRPATGPGWVRDVGPAARVVRADLEALGNSTAASGATGNRSCSGTDETFVIDPDTAKAGAPMVVELLGRIHAVLIDIAGPAGDRTEARGRSSQGSEVVVMVPDQA